MKSQRWMGRRVGGQSSVEYLVILVFVVMVLVNGNPSPMQQFFDAVKGAYQNFSYAMSAIDYLPTPTTT